MSDKKYLDMLFEIPEYVGHLEDFAEKLMQVRKHKRKVEDLEKEVLWYIGKEEEGYMPDYGGFTGRIYDEYLKNTDVEEVMDSYHRVQEDPYEDLHEFWYCLILFSKKLNEQREYLLQPVSTEEKTDEQEREELLEYTKLLNSVKLLHNLLENMEPLLEGYVKELPPVEEKVSFQTLYASLLGLYQQGKKDEFYQGINDNLDALIQFAEDGEIQAMEFMNQAYVEQRMSGIYNEKLAAAVREYRQKH